MKTGNFYYPIQQALRDLNTQINYNRERAMQQERDVLQAETQNLQIRGQLEQQKRNNDFRQAQFEFQQERARVSDEHHDENMKWKWREWNSSENRYKRQIAEAQMKQGPLQYGDVANAFERPEIQEKFFGSLEEVAQTRLGDPNVKIKDGVLVDKNGKPVTNIPRWKRDEIKEMGYASAARYLSDPNFQLDLEIKDLTAKVEQGDKDYNQTEERFAHLRLEHQENKSQLFMKRIEQASPVEKIKRYNQTLRDINSLRAKFAHQPSENMSKLWNAMEKNIQDQRDSIVAIQAARVKATKGTFKDRLAKMKFDRDVVQDVHKVVNALAEIRGQQVLSPEFLEKFSGTLPMNFGTDPDKVESNMYAYFQSVREQLSRHGETDLLGEVDRLLTATGPNPLGIDVRIPGATRELPKENKQIYRKLFTTDVERIYEEGTKRKQSDKEKLEKIFNRP